MSRVPESQAEANEMKAANQKKINKLIVGIITQFAVLAVIVFATFQANYIAEWLLYGYSAVVALGCASYMIVSMKSAEWLSKHVKKDHSMLISSPTAKVMRGIGIMFSLVEIPIMLNHGFYWIAGLWLVTEIFQFIAAYKLGAALLHKSVDADTITKDQFTENPDWAEEYVKDCAELQAHIDEHDLQMNDLEPFSDPYEKIARARQILINEMEARVTRAAQETIQNL